jgi:DNA (cytosine-5)-methyltransferase 1
MKNLDYSLMGLFAGVGGIELGFKQAGFNPIVANEFDKHAGETYRENHKHNLILKSIKDLEIEELPKIDVLTGGFPCQAFSLAGYRKGFEDPRGNLFWDIIRIAEEKEPQIIFLENVKNLTGHDNGKTFQVIEKTLKEIGYFVKFDVLNSSQYGNVPQNRERIYIVGFRKKKFFEIFAFPSEIKLTKKLSDFIDFNSKVDIKYYYGKDKYMYKELSKSIKSSDTIYQWRRQYVRENKSNLCPTLTANMGTGGHNVPLVLTKFGIRKLTPRECFNLMGFPSNFKLPTNVPDSQLYKQAGNAVVVPVIKRIALNINAAIQNKKLPSSKAYNESLFD